MVLTESDRRILWTLTRKVRVLTVQQVAHGWFGEAPHPSRQARKSLMKLVTANLVQEHQATMHPMIAVTAPLLVWRPGGSEPDFGALSYQLKRRWSSPVIAQSLYHATREANRLFGGYIGGRKPRISETTHDVHLAQVYLNLLKTNPRAAANWVSEHQLHAEGGGRNERLPDAVIRYPRRKAVQLVVEFGGSYSKCKLIEFHEALRHFCYEIW